MKERTPESGGLADLRRQAEALADGRWEVIPDMSPAEVRKLVHDLHTHQVELEMQNEQLRQAQEHLMDAHERLSDLYDFAPIGYLTLDRNNVILEANLTAATMLNLERRSLIERPVTRFIVKEDQDTFYKHHRALVRGEKSLRCELRLRRHEGEPFWATLESAPIRGDTGEDPRGMRIAVADVTEIHHARELAEATALEKRLFEERLQQTQKLESLGVMAGGVAHDFNNILMVIQGYIELAKAKMPSESVGHRYLHEVQTAAARATELSKQMLAYSGKGVLDTQKLDLSALVGEMAHLLESSHGKMALLEYDFATGLPGIEGDPSQLRQIVMNLITNASDAIGDEGGTIAVKTGVTEVSQDFLASTYAHDNLPGGDYVYVEVTDSGCGMEEETKRRLFEPFFTTKFTGRGLGMAAALGIVRAHKGAITIRSAPGRGTTIRVLLPALEHPVDMSAREKSAIGDWVGQGTLLVVDDEVQIRTLLRLILEEKGFTVLTANNGREALEVFQIYAGEIVCVLLDLTMPHMGGVEACAEMRRIRDDVPVVLVSGYSEETLKERGKHLGFTGFLKKPVENDTVLETVRSAVRS